jgi:hypothetical protein
MPVLIDTKRNKTVSATQNPPAAKGSIMSQPEVRHMIAKNRLIDQLLKTILGLSSGAARVRLTLIRNGTEPLRYDVANSIALRGRWLGPARQNQPLSDWKGFLPALLTGQCVLHRIPEVRMAAPAFGFPSSRPSRALVCPVAGADGNLLGAIFTVWDGAAQPPEHTPLRSLMAAGKHVATQIAAVLHPCGALSDQTTADESGRFQEPV